MAQEGIWAIPDHGFAQYECYHFYELRERNRAGALPVVSSENNRTAARPTAPAMQSEQAQSIENIM